MSIVSFTTRKRKRKNQSPEVQATEALHSLIYGGAGKKFLGWQWEQQTFDRKGRPVVEPAGWRYWSIPAEPDQRRWWHPIWDHLKGNHRGVVALGAKDVPFVGVDLDRHGPSLPAHEHIVRVLKTGRLLKRHFPELYWPVAEVNANNGSAKFFGFAGKPIPIETALDLARRIHDFLVENGLGDLEIFPYNCGQVGLPMRTDKTTIVSSGVLDKCFRKKKVDGRMVPFETYSAVALLEAIRCRSPYDEDCLHRALKVGCANLPDRPKPEVVSVLSPHAEKPVPKPEVAQTPKTVGDYSGEPNALTRQLPALKELARRLRRVPREEEALSFIKENGLYGGDWRDKAVRRRGRVRWMLRHIAKTFDPNKCSTAKYKVQFGKYDNWSRTHVGTLRETVRRYVDEYGEVHERRGRSVVGWRFVSTMLSVLEVCFSNPNPDKSLPQNAARAIWDSSFRAGLTDVRWNDNKWTTARDWLHEMGIIEVFDRNWRFGRGHGQAMKWRATQKFYDLHVWYKTKRQPSVNEPVLLVDFLAEKQTHPPLNYYPNTEPLLASSDTKEERCRPPPWRPFSPLSDSNA